MSDRERSFRADVAGQPQTEPPFPPFFKLLRLQIERMPLAYLLMDADCRIIEWNPAAERIFGYSKEEVLGMGPPYEKLVHESFHHGVRQIMDRLRSGDMCANSVNDNRTKDGRSVTCEWFNTPLVDDQGRFLGLFCLAQDVTERKRLEEQYRQTQKMEAIGKLAGGIAHDFNNLLTIVAGNSDLALAELRHGDPLRTHLEEIQSAVALAASLTRQLLAFSRKQVLVPTVLDLNALVGDMGKMLRRLIGEDIELSFLPGRDLSPVRVDAGQMEQVIMNIVLNARDAMPRGGKLTIQTANVVLDETYATAHSDAKVGDFVLLTITDTGCGMDHATQARIFEPFFTTKDPERGTGLGLATVYGIVSQSGGHMAVSSKLGAGTTFRIYLPPDRQPLSAKISAAPRETKQRSTETILLVEDEAGVRTLARTILERNGYHVLLASHGREAFRICEEYEDTIHLLATDVVMPNMSGCELAERSWKLRPRMKVLFLSGYMDDEVLRHGLIQERTPFLQKPYTSEQLASTVREVLDRP